MPTLTVGDKSVEVGDEFLKLSPEQQNAAVADIAKQLGASNTAAEGLKPEPVTLNKVVRSTATGVPVVGGVLNKLNAATNATLAPVVEPFLAPSEADISRKGESWAERYRKSEAMQNLADERFAAEHPIIDIGAKITGGVAGSVPLMMAAPAAFGLTGTLPQMVARGAASNAALAAADAAVRGEDIRAPAAIGGAFGAAAPVVARGVGAAARAYREARSPTAPVRQNVEDIAGVPVPLTKGQAASDPIAQAEEEIMRRGGRGSSAETIARQADEEARQAVAQAQEGISQSMAPGGAARTLPMQAADTVQAELTADAMARQAAADNTARQVAARGDALARDLGGGAAPGGSAIDAAEQAGAAVAARRADAIARRKAAYEARNAVPGTFEESVPQNLAEDIRGRLNTGEDPLWVDPTNQSTANQALRLIDQTVGKESGLFRNQAGPKPAVTAPAAKPLAGVDETVEALRAKFGDSVADAFARQNKPAEQAPLSLLQFVAKRGGLAPHGELDAIGLGLGHREQIPGEKGFFGAVRKNGSDIDRMREMAEEAGYLRGEHGATSTPTQFLDAIEAELRGQKVFPEGHAGFKGKKEAVAGGAREAAELERVNLGFERDLEEAGHGGMSPDVRTRAVSLMRDEGMSADDAVDHALRQLDQEDAAVAGARGGFPGDAAERAAAAGEPLPVDLKVMDEARKRLVTMFGDAKSAAIRTGDRSDMRAMGKILAEFDNVIGDALASGKFSGDAALAKELQDAARKSHADYKKLFASRGPGDEVGRKVEKILGRYGDDAATPEQILEMSYGPKSRPGTGSAVKVGVRMRQILGENSPEYAQWRQGVLGYVDDASLSPAKRADRLDNFLGTSWAKTLLTPEQRTAMRDFSRDLRATEPRSTPLSKLEKDIARIDGTDGSKPATVDEVAKMITAGTGDSQRLLAHLKGRLTPEGWGKVKQSIFDDLVNAPAGHNEFTNLQKSKRLSDYLGSQVAEVVNTPAERAEMAKLASVYKRMVQLPGTTNPSGTAPMLAKIAKKAGDNLLALIGLSTQGVPGAVAGHAIQRGVEALKDAKAGKEALRLFYGPQARRPIKQSRLPYIAAASAPAAQR